MLDKICTDLETSKKLKELGIEMETEFLWWCSEIKPFLTHDHKSYDADYKDNSSPREHCKAFKCEDQLVNSYTLEQILDMLPNNINLPRKRRINGKLYIGNYYLGWEPNSFYYGRIKLDDTLYYHNKKGESRATTAARLLIKLIEDGIINLKE